MNKPIGQSTLGEMLPLFIIIGILLLVIIFSTRMVVATSKAKKKQKHELTTLKTQGLTMRMSFKHVNGLPIAENLNCEINSYNDRLEFKSGTTNIKLPRNKITDMCIKTDVEIQKQVVSSAGGAVAGGLAFGPLGAIIGGRIKTKNIRTATHYLIITYTDSGGKLAFIGFEVTNNLTAAGKLITEFKKLNSTSGIQINL